jgi:hypothetical protein
MEDEMKTGKKSTPGTLTSIGSRLLNGAAIALSLSTLLYWRVLESMEPASINYLSFLAEN